MQPVNRDLICSWNRGFYIFKCETSDEAPTGLLSSSCREEEEEAVSLCLCFREIKPRGLHAHVCGLHVDAVCKHDT